MKLHKHSVSGVALVIVLGFLVIISALAVAFFSSVNTELKASRNFAAGMTTRQLADSAVQVVMGQIAAATTRGVDISGTGLGNEAWASQPGMIRVYGTNLSSGSQASASADAFYKLYSSSTMILTGSDLLNFKVGGATPDYTNAKGDAYQSWDTAPALWTDLNAPVLVRDPTTNQPVPRFPIIDPRSYVTAVDTTTPFTDTKWNNNVEGFTYDASAVHGAVGPGNGNNQRLPMPVRWIYVLQDGTLTTPDNGTTTATFTTNVPTAQNPIVGRIAFWTDDETCKLNLNTAAGFTQNTTQLNAAYRATPSAYAGSFWDTPRFYTQFDYGIPDQLGMPQSNQTSGGLALCQLVQNEFQRYPGHPGTTSLAPVLNGLLTSDQLYTVVPRYSNLNLSGAAGSTNGGTARVVVDPYPNGGTVQDLTVQDKQELQPKQDRLYASVDEFLFGAKVKVGNFTTTSYARITNNNYANITGNVISPDVIDKLRFFVTTQSRAPELNLFGQPRISIWPVRAETAGEVTGLNVFDNLILFCSTVGGANAGTSRPDTKTDQTVNGVYRYIFTRRELPNTVATGAISNASLVTHNDTILGGGGPAQKQYELNTNGYTADCDWPRNKRLLGTYLMGTSNPPGLMNRPIPGVGQAISAKYNAGDTQDIVTEIFDYIRAANSQDTTTSIAPPAKTIKFAPRGYIIPSQPNYLRNLSMQAKGFGRMSTLCEVSLDFYYAGPQMDTAAAPAGAPANTGWSKWDNTNPAKRYVAVGTADASGKAKVKGGFMRAFLLFSTFDPMQGYAPKFDPGLTDPKLSIECKWLQDWTVTPNGGSQASLGFPTPGTIVATTCYRSPVSYWGGRPVGGYEGFMHTLMGGPITSVTPTTGNWTSPQKIMWSHNLPLLNTDAAITTGVGFTNAGNSPIPGNSFTNITSANAATQEEYYPFQTDIGRAIPIPGPATVDPTTNSAANSFIFSGGDLQVNLYYGSSSTNPAVTAFPALQTFNLTFPPHGNLPFPQGPPFQPLNKVGASVTVAPTADVTTWGTMLSTDTNFNFPAPSGVSPGVGMHNWYWTGNGAFFANAVANFVRAKPASFGVFSYYTSLQASWSFATRLAWVMQPGAYPTVGGGGTSYEPYANSSGSPIAPGYFADRWRCIVQPGDTIRSLLYWNATNAATKGPLTGMGVTAGGDLRIGQLTPVVPKTSFMAHPDYNGQQSRASVLRGGDGGPYFPVGNVNQPTNTGTPTGTQLETSGAPAAYYISSTDSTKEPTLGNHIPLAAGGWRFQASRAFANLPWGTNTVIPTAQVNGIVRADGSGQYQGDFDTGLGDFADGPFCNKQDEGNVIFRYQDYNLKWVYPIPYFTNTWSYQQPGNTFTSPSREMPSAGMFGSLPSQVGAGNGWQTLCFCPNTPGANHPGNVDPKDHYLLDWFMMPVVEPYPISEPFSTAGKVNINYRIAPFDYIRRSTALRGALYPLRVTAVNSQANQPAKNANFLTYKVGQLDSNGSTITDAVTGNPAPLTTNFRLQLDRDETILAMDAFYDAGAGSPDGGFFKSASQICERYLYPRGHSFVGQSGNSETADMQTWWRNNGDLTGDNEREKPYTDLYPRITTKSNTYTVHMRVQTLRQARSGPTADYTTWIEGKDNVLGEYRGSATIERYVDPADPRFAPGANAINPDTQSVEPLYHFRTVITKKFTP